MKFYDIYEYRDGINYFDLLKSWQYLEHIAKDKMNPEYALAKTDYPVYKKLLAYAIRDQAQCDAISLDLSKGILLVGKVGVGKTSYMNLLPMLMYHKYRYSLESSLDITSDYKEFGESIIKMYSRKSVNVNHLCIDDLGLEKEVNHYGNKTNVIGEILYKRHRLMIEQGVITHATTNLNADELANKYGNRLRSRMREMFNIVSFPKESRDKRR